MERQLPFLSFISMSCMTPPMLQPVHSPPLSSHLHYQLNYWLPNWMTSLLCLHFMHPFLVILLVDYVYTSVTCPQQYLVLHLAPVCACCWVYFHSYGLSHPLIQGKGVTIEWLLVAYMYFIVPYERTDKHVKNSLYIYNLEMCQSSLRFFPMIFFPTQRAFALCLFP